jgi:hypothetical protein
MGCSPGLAMLQLLVWGRPTRKLKIPDEMRVIIDALWEFSTER